MALTKEKTAATVSTFGANEKDTGNTKVQVALLTERINHLNEHLIKNPNDNHSRRGLLQMVGQRKSFLKYLESKDINAYRELKARLKIR